MNQYAVERKLIDEYAGHDTVDEVRAVRASPGTVNEIAAWCGGISETVEDVARPGYRRTWILVSTPTGVVPAGMDDWIVREWTDLDDESSVRFYVYGQDEFLRRYRPVP